ncbi:YcxB family protein [Primorskyibacter sp. 2E233]|uniref:YcxB family protein n=1 Tax=Primorskyibacter sp. 2E233 TaxID=3413431 RepID=UPI003BF1C58F
MMYEFDYTPTKAEVAKGMQMACRSIYRGGWTILTLLYGVFVGASFAMAGFIISFLVFRAFGYSNAGQQAPIGWWLVAMAFAAGMMSFGRVIRRRSAEAYLTGPVMKGQRLSLSDEGISFNNGRSHSLTVWSDIDTIQEAKQLIMPTMGNQGYVLPDRMLAQAGDSLEIRDQIKAWHSAARRAA